MNDFTELDELPFYVPDEFGELVGFHKECLGVYYIATTNENEYSPVAAEYYIVTDEATMISETARIYGKQIGTSPFLLAYDLNDSSSGKYIIDYESYDTG